MQPLLHYCDCVKNCCFAHYLYNILFHCSEHSPGSCVCVHACFHTPPTSTVSTVKAFSEHPSQHHIQSCRALHEAQHYIRNQPNHSASHCVRLRKLLPTMGQVHLSSKHSCKGLKTAARPSRLSHPLMTSPVLLSIPEPNPGPVG